MQDFLVIGGGIAGVSVAARLSHLGTVTLLEAEEGLGYHASGRSAAMFVETYGPPSTLALNRASRAHLEGAHGGVLSPRGVLLVGTRANRAAFERDMAEMSMRPIPLEQGLEMVPGLDPGALTQLGYLREALDIDTDLLIQNFARELRANGGKLRTGERVGAITRTTRGWEARTGARAFTARMLVNAAGAWADELAEMAGIGRFGFTAYRRSVARIPAPGGRDVAGWPMLLGAGEQWYAKPDAGCLLVSPADATPAVPHDAWPEDETLAEGIARYEEVMREGVTRLVGSWAGLRTFAPDGALVLGPDPRESTFIWMAGQGGYGFQTAPAASQLVADLVAGRQSALEAPVIAALSPARLV